MKHIGKLTSILALSTLAATPAFAHAGPHHFGFFGNLIHFLSQPNHALFAFVGSLAIIALSRKLRTSNTQEK